MAGITKGPWSVERQGPSCATIWAGDQCVFDAIDVAGNEANLIAMGEVPAMVAALKEARQWIAKGIADGAYDGCAAPLAPNRWLDRAGAILSRIDGATPTGNERTISAAHLDALTVAARKYADDLETGLEDGLYDDRADLDAARAALAAVEGGL